MDQNKSASAMHVSLYVKDIEATVEFYNRFFESVPVKVKPQYVKYELDSPSLIISFIEKNNPVPTFGHLGFRVGSESELQRKYKSARFQKLDLFEERDINCCYAIQDKFWVADPDGYRWEVYYFHEDSDFIDPDYEPIRIGKEKEEAAPCC